jgi:predicted dehydrogenase
MTQIINWGIIGLGNVALKFAEAFKDSNNSKLKAVSSNTKDKINKFQKKFNIDKNYCFNKYEDLLDCKEIDIVYIALPNSMHKEWINKSIEKKKNILIEKPAFIDLSQTENIKKKINDYNLFFSEGFIYRYSPQILEILELLKNNTIGEPKSMVSNYGINLLTKKNIFGLIKKKKINNNNRLYSKKLGGGAILDLGCYPVSLSMLVASTISKIDCEKISVVNKIKEIGSSEVDINSHARIEFENGFVSDVNASFSKEIGKETVIIGSEGLLKIVNPWQIDPPTIILEGKINKKIEIECAKNIFLYQINNISKNLLEGKSKPDFPGVSINETIELTKILNKWLN